MMHIHSIFDLLAATASFALTTVVYLRWLKDDAPSVLETSGAGYAVALIAGAITGGYFFGALNLWLTGAPGIGRSILGALAGAIAFVEIFKKIKGIKGSTGLIFVPAFACSVMVGRWGCFLSGLEDQTHGVETSLPWGHDFGDGLLRHPVQLYESFAMTAFLIAALVMIARRQPMFMRNGFYLLVLWYAGQRFIWEFLKPYGTVFLELNIFHFLCLGLIVYAVAMMRGGQNERSTA